MKIIWLILFSLLSLGFSQGFDYYSAKDLLFQKKYDQARTLLNYVGSNQKVLNNFINYYIADSYYQEKNYLKALALFTEYGAGTINVPYYRDSFLKKMDCYLKLNRSKELADKDLAYYGEALFYKGRYAECTDVLAKIVSKNIQDKLYLGRGYIYSGFWAKGVPLLKQVNNVEGVYYLGTAYLAGGNKIFAEKYFLSVLANYSDSEYAPKALLNLVRLEIAKGRQQKALGYYKELFRSYPHSALADDAAWFIGRHYYQYRNYAAAEDYFINGAIQNPTADFADTLLYWAGKAALKVNKVEEAEIIFKKVVQLYPQRYYGHRAAQYLKTVPQLPISTQADGLIVEQTEIPKTIKILLEQQAFDDAYAELERIKIEQKLNKDNAFTRAIKYQISNGAYAAEDYYNSIKGAVAWLGYAEEAEVAIPLEAWQSAYPLGYNKIIQKHLGEQNVISVYYVNALIREESLYDPKAFSWAKAYGLMQIIPSTGKMLAKRLAITDEYSEEKLFEPEMNIRMGIAYLTELMGLFNNDLYLVLSGYNAGPGVTQKWKKQFTLIDLDEFIENIPYNETRHYVKRVMKSYWVYQLIYTGTVK